MQLDGLDVRLRHDLSARRQFLALIKFIELHGNAIIKVADVSRFELMRLFICKQLEFAKISPRTNIHAPREMPLDYSLQRIGHDLSVI